MNFSNSINIANFSIYHFKEFLYSLKRIFFSVYMIQTILIIYIGSIIFFTIYKMTKIVHNPFLRQNPYFVPQRFYSHQKINNYGSRLDSSPFQIYEKPNNDHIYALQAKRQNYIKDYNLSVPNLDDNNRKGNPLKRKNINTIENPFYRKNLVQIIKEKVEQIPYRQDLQSKHYRLFQSTKIQQNEVQKNYEVRILSSKNILEEKENKPKYLSSQLKIKLKSQTQINQHFVSTQVINSHEKSGFVTLGKVQLSNQYLSSLRINGIPQTISAKGKTFYLQVIE